VLTLTGGAIGQGLPVAIGAAIAAPQRPVVALQADGSAMYTISALWTMAREQLDITLVILNNRAYAILHVELMRVGASGAGTKAQSCSICPIPISTSSPSPKGSACPQRAPPQPKNSRPNSALQSVSPGHISWMPRFPLCRSASAG
jgi:Thiamine pyrophosphate enzyme, C-terminal TPP binding domain